MNIKKISILISIFLIFSLGLTAQDAFGFLPKVNVSTKFSKLKWANSLATRHSLYEKENEIFQHQYVLADFTSIVSTKILHNKTIYGGYMLRSKEGEFIHRLIQRFAWVQRLETARLGHRFGIDQTFAPENDMVFRMRYRILLEKSLQGEKVNPQEFYLKLANEYLLAFKETAQPEARLIANIGYELNPRSKLELGLDNRFSDFTNNSLQYKIWLTLTWFTSFSSSAKKKL